MLQKRKKSGWLLRLMVYDVNFTCSFHIFFRTIIGSNQKNASVFFSKLIRNQWSNIKNVKNNWWKQNIANINSKVWKWMNNACILLNRIKSKNQSACLAQKCTFNCFSVFFFTSAFFHTLQKSIDGAKMPKNFSKFSFIPVFKQKQLNDCKVFYLFQVFAEYLQERFPMKWCKMELFLFPSVHFK